MRKKIWYWIIPSYRRLHDDREMMLAHLEATHHNLHLYERLYQEMADVVVKQDECIRFLRDDRDKSGEKVDKLAKMINEVIEEDGVSEVQAATAQEITDGIRQVGV
ncbi:hypothetical protein [Aneurinibacillus soli]|nr:hypothetical protein [Aneurinibacillus soli]